MEAVEYRSQACQEVAAAEVEVEGRPYRASAVAEGCQREIREHLGAALVEGESQRDHQGQRGGQERQERQRESQARQEAVVEEEEEESLQLERRSLGVRHPRISERLTQSRP